MPTRPNTRIRPDDVPAGQKLRQLIVEGALERRGQETRPIVDFYKRPPQYGPERPQPQEQPEPEDRFFQPTEEQMLSGNYLAGWTPESGQPPPGETELPQGAERWDPFGRPYYGDGLAGWVNKLKSKLLEPIGGAPERVFEESPLHDMTPSEFAASSGAEKAALLGGALGAVVGTAGNIRDWLWSVGGEEGETKMNIFGYIARFSGLAIEGLLDVAGEPAKKTEQAMEIAAGLEEIGEDAGLPGYQTFQDMYDRGGKDIVPESLRPAADVAIRFMDFVRTSIGPTTVAYNAFRAVISPKDLDEKKTAIERDYHSGRVAYSNILDPLVKEEYVRRFDAGENPYMLAMELENPIAEAAGQLIFDPLNLLGIGTRGARDARRLAGVEDELIKVADKVTDYLKAMEAGDDVRAAEMLPELVKVVQESAQDVGKLGDEFAALQGLTAPTPEAKRYVTITRFGELAKWIGSEHDGETALDMFKATFLLTSDDLDEVAQGISFANNSTLPQALHSRAGLEMGHVLRNVTDGDFVKFVDDLKVMIDDKPLPEIIKILGKKVEKAVDSMYPTIPEAVSAKKKIAELKAAGQVIPPNLALQAAREAGPLYRSISAFHNIAQKPYRFVNNILSSIYMGLSPGYVARNFSTDTLTAVIDYGLGVLKKAPRKWADNTSEWLGGYLPAGVMGFGPHKGIAGAKTNWYKPGFVWAESIELKSANRVVGYTVERTMMQMMKPGRALPEIRPLIDAGLDPKAARELAKLIINNKGNVKAARKAWNAMHKTGTIDNFKNLAFLSDDVDATLRAFNTIDNNLYNKILDAAGGGQIDDVLEELTRIKEEFLGIGDDIAGEAPTIRPDSPMLDDIRYMSDARAQGDVTDDFVSVATRYTTATDNSIMAGTDFVSQLYYGAKAEGKVEDVDFLAKIAHMATGKVSNEVKAGVAEFSDKFINPWYAHVRNDIWSGKTTAADAWANLVTSGRRYVDLTDVPVPTKATFGSAFWDEFVFPAKNNAWIKYRDDLYDVAQQMSEKFPNTHSDILFTEVDRAYGLSKMYDDFTFSYLDKFKVARMEDAGLYGDAIRKIASGYDLPSITEEGAELDQMLLNIINKYGVGEGKPGFTLADLRTNKITDMDMVRESFVMHQAGKRGLLPEVAKAAEAAPGDIVYHATQREFEGLPVATEGVGGEARRFFDEPEGTYYNISQEEAKQATGFGEKQRIIPAEISAKKTYLVNDETADAFSEMYRRAAKNKGWKEGNIEDWMAASPGIEREVSKEFTNLLKAEGYDSVYKTRTGDFIALDPDAVRTTEAAKAVDIDDLAKQFDIPEPPTPYTDGGTPTLPRVVHESETAIKNLFNQLEDAFVENWGATTDVLKTPKLTGMVDDFFKGAEKGVAEARLLATGVANEARKFTLLSYPEKTNLDLALGYILPYQFWYNRTYRNWMRRIVQTPDVIAGYAKYKEALAKQHAGAPDWWKYNINSYELFGIMKESPLFFNLEATLNPMNGLTGVDFNDPKRRVNWWTNTLDDLNKLGPSIWTPISIATAIGLQAMGEDEAAERWGGRLIPQTATLKSLTHLLNIGPPGGVELDPNVAIFSGGIDTYERRRIGRAMGALVEEGALSEADAIEGANFREGPAWDMARERAMDLRAPGQLSSFFLGVGFKARTVSDITIDNFYSAYSNLWEREPDLTTEEFRTMMDEMRGRYPFMDTVLLAGKSGVWRERAYAYNIMSRIPPGQKDDIAEAVGIDPDLLVKFWEDKGKIGEWKEAEKNAFMNGVVQIGALLDIPDDATRTEWRAASNAYGNMVDDIERIFGSDIQNQFDYYYELKYSEDQLERDKADRMLEFDPILSNAIEWQTKLIVENPMLEAYYVSQSKMKKYYQGIEYAKLDAKYPGARELQEQYYEIFDTKERKAFLKANSILKDYWDDKDVARKEIANQTVDALKGLPEGRPAEIRPGVEPETIGEGKLVEQLEGPENIYFEYSASDWKSVIGSDEAWNLLLDHLLGDEDLPYTVEGALDFLADRTGLYDVDILLKLIKDSLQ